MKNFLKKAAIITMLFCSYQINAQTYFSGNTTSSTGSALGASNTSNSTYTFASGSSNNVTSGYCIGMGLGTQVTGAYSASIGVYSYATGYVSYSIGNRAKATGYEAYSIGSYSQATSTHSYTFGRQSITSGTDAYTFGRYSGGSGSVGFSIGSYATANGANSYAIGEYVSTSNTGSMTIGRGINSGTKLSNGTANSLAIGFNSDIPTFFVGASSGSGTTGDIGIANSSPQAKLHVTGNGESFLLEGDDKAFMSFYPQDYGSGRMGYFGFKDSLTTDITIENEVDGGDISIITDTGSINLVGSVWTKEIVVQLTDPWPDYVFEKKYKKHSLYELEKFIEINKHLPNVPSAIDIEIDGVNLAQMDAILLEKIEELTLYTIEQQKLIDKQAKLIDKLLVKTEQ